MQLNDTYTILTAKERREATKAMFDAGWDSDVYQNDDEGDSDLVFHAEDKSGNEIAVTFFWNNDGERALDTANHTVGEVMDLLNR